MRTKFVRVSHDYGDTVDAEKSASAERLMLRRIQAPKLGPMGASVEFVDGDHDSLGRFPLVIEGSPLMSAYDRYRNFEQLELWLKLCAMMPNSELFSEADDHIVDAVRRLYLQHDDRSDYYKGIDSVLIFYTKAKEFHVMGQLSKLLYAPTFLACSSGVGGPIHVRNRSSDKLVLVQDSNGTTKSLIVMEQLFDIEVPNPGVLVFLNNSSDPSLYMVLPNDGPPVSGFTSSLVPNEKKFLETIAWKDVEGWFNRLGVPVTLKGQHPNGENSFPDYRARIGDQKYDIEMTSVRVWANRAFRGNLREPEKKAREVAAQPSEQREEVIDELHRVLVYKAKIAAESLRATPMSRLMLVITNWSMHPLYDEDFCPEKLDAFDVVLLIDDMSSTDKVRCIKGEIAALG